MKVLELALFQELQGQLFEGVHGEYRHVLRLVAANNIEMSSQNL